MNTVAGRRKRRERGGREGRGGEGRWKKGGAADNYPVTD